MCGTIVLQCTCEHKFQDQKYGPTWRLHNLNDTNFCASCTVCGRVKSGRSLLLTKEYLTEVYRHD